MKKILLSTMILTGLVSSTLASVPFRGFYVGGGLTYSNGDLKAKAANSSTTSSGTTSSSGAGVNGFLGYGCPIYQGLYLGGELGFGYDGSRFNKPAFGLKSTSKLTYNILGRLGYVFSSFLAYAKVGYEGRSKIKIDNTTQSLSRDGFLLGIGGDYAVTEKIFLRAEYTYNFGSRKKFSATRGTVTFRTPTNTILIGGGYKF